MKPFLRKATLRRLTTFAITLIFLVTFFVTPAYADDAGPNLPTIGESMTGPGTAWTNPGNITAADGNAATASVLAGGGLTKYLRGTQFGFAIPAGSTIQGIKVEIYRRTTGNPNPQLRDYEVKLVKGGTIVGDNKADTTNDWPHASYEMATYGGPGDLWGASPWTVDDINATDFGVVLAVRNQNPTNNKAAWVDYMRISVEYAPADNPSLTLVKTATPTTYDSVDDVINYSFELTNSGNVTLSGDFTVTDDKTTNEDCPATATLAPETDRKTAPAMTTTVAPCSASSRLT
jgi:hypothetical protein